MQIGDKQLTVRLASQTGPQPPFPMPVTQYAPPPPPIPVAHRPPPAAAITRVSTFSILSILYSHSSPQVLKLSNLVLASELVDDQEVADITEDVRNEVSIQLRVLSNHL